MLHKNPTEIDNELAYKILKESISNIDIKKILQKMCEDLETFFRNGADLPHYKWVVRPMYKLFGGNRYPLFSVPATFCVTDVLFHQSLSLILRTIFEQEVNPYFQVACSMLWIGLSIPIAIHKYNNGLDKIRPKSRSKSI